MNSHTHEHPPLHTHTHMQGQPCLVQCPYNDRHFIAKSSVEKHKPKCRYGVVGVTTDNEVVSDKRTSNSTFVSIG